MTEVADQPAAVRPAVSRRRAGVRVSVPARTSISVIDMNEFAPGRAGGGNLGVTLDLRTVLSVRPATGDCFSSSGAGAAADGLLRYVCERWCALTGVADPFQVTVEHAPPAHVGLGSSASLQLALWAGLNWLYGCDLSDTELRSAVSASYRETDQDTLVSGFTTGLSAFLNLYGGFAAIDVDLRVIFHEQLPAWHYAVAIHRDYAAVSAGESELQTLMGRGCEYDVGAGAEKRRLIHEVAAAVRGADLVRFGNVVRELQSLGSKRAEVMLHGHGLYEVIDRLRADGTDAVFMSAVGPGLVLLSESPLQPRTAQAHGLELLARGRVDNVGIILETLP